MASRYYPRFPNPLSSLRRFYPPLQQPLVSGQKPKRRGGCLSRRRVPGPTGFWPDARGKPKACKVGRAFFGSFLCTSKERTCCRAIPAGRWLRNATCPNLQPCWNVRTSISQARVKTLPCAMSRFHVGTGHTEPTRDAGYTTARNSNQPNLSISFLDFGGSPYRKG
jgi:hypothetical protein